MRPVAAIKKELEQKEAVARQVKAWLDANPTAPLHERLNRRQCLKVLLHEITDLVCELKPSLPYPITSKHSNP